MTAATATAPAPDLAAPAGDPLTALDPCDGHAHTGIPAMVRLAHPRAGGLDLCKHDYETNELALTAGGWVVTDDRRHELA